MSRVIETTAPQAQRCQCHYADQNRSKPDHDVITVIEQGNVIRQTLRRKLVQALYLRSPSLIRQEAERARDRDGIVQAVLFEVRLSNNGERGSVLAIIGQRSEEHTSEL